jgi:hypothetical protein
MQTGAAMKILSACSAVALIACYGTGAKPDTTNVDSGVVSSPAVHDTVTRSDTASVPLGGELELRTGKSSYRPGEEMELTLVNPTNNTYTYNPCTRLVERQASGRWTQLEEMRMCTMIAHILAPRSRRTERTELTNGLEPGSYRVILVLSLSGPGATGSGGVRVSAPITVTR